MHFEEKVKPEINPLLRPEQVPGAPCGLADFSVYDLEGGKVVFLHHPKTGGTTLHNILINAFEREKICPERFNGLRYYAAGELAGYRLFSGHFDLPSVRLIPGPKKIVTMLREPVGRLISIYYFLRAHRQGTIEDNGLDLARLANDYSMADFFRLDEVRLHPWVNNSMARVLTGTIGGTRWESMARAVNPDVPLSLGSAIRELEALDAFGIMERYDDSARLICECVGIEVPTKIERRQVLEVIMDEEPGLRRIEKEPVTDETRHLIEGLVQTDIEIYRHACGIFDKRVVEKRALALILSGAVDPEGFRKRFVEGVYLSLLGREPDADGLATYMERLKNTNDLPVVIDEIIHSEEFIQRYGLINSPSAANEPCLVFLHIQKTGGTSVLSMLSESYNSSSIYWEHGDSLFERTPKDLCRYSIFSGHFNYDSLAFIPARELSLFTFLREPKKRLMSLYNFWRGHGTGHPSYHFAMRMASGLPAESFFETQQIMESSQVWNHMAWAIMGNHKWHQWKTMLSRQPDQYCIDEIIETNIRPTIRSRLREFKFIGLQENFEESVNILYHKLGKERPETIRADNSLESLMMSGSNFKKIERQPMTARLDVLLDRLVQLDNIVYEEGKKLYENQLSEFLNTGYAAPVNFPAQFCANEGA